MALASLVGFATIGSSIGLMASAAYIVATAALHPPLAALQVAIVGVRFFGIARGGFRYLERTLAHQVTLRLLARLRVWFYRGLEPLSPARLVQVRSGDLLSRVVADIETLELFYLRVVAPAAVALLVAALMAVFVGRFNAHLAAVLIAFLALTGIALPLATSRIGRGAGRRLVQVRAELNAALVDGIQGVADLLAFDRGPQHLAHVAALSERLACLQARIARGAALNDALGGLLANLATVTMLAVAVPLVSAGRLDGVNLTVLLMAAIASFEAVLPLPLACQHLETNLAAARRLFEIIDAPPAVRDPDTPSPQPADYGLVVEGLRFRYAPDEAPALDGVSFCVPQGGHLAVVGPSGSGKTTLASLLLRFWDYQEGHIRLGGHELRAYQSEELRRLLSVVSQNTHLFAGTLRDNLLLARPEAEEADLWRALRQAQLEAFARQLPDGLGTWIGEQGLRLSAGERQRVAIARGLLRDAPFLILDEATANLDTLTERDLLKALDALMAGRTSLIITHRLVGLESADEVLVLHAGRIVERGRHTDLLQADTLYRRMWQLQRDG